MIGFFFILLMGCKENKSVDSEWQQPNEGLFDEQWWENDTATPFPEGDQSNNASSNSPDPSTADSVRGEQLYVGKCSSCHGTDGEGGIGPSLALSVPLLSNEQLFVIIRDGGQGMPSELLGSIADIADVMAFLRSWEE